MLAAPMARLQQKTQAAVTTGKAGAIRHSLRGGFNGCFVLSSECRA
ncbi:MAG TPA: hypothetical protein VJR47_19120 [Stellaceae bacterium]|nr:hypothetical protein [Stellaceae bacterium]